MHVIINYFFIIHNSYNICIHVLRPDLEKPGEDCNNRISPVRFQSLT